MTKENPNQNATQEPSQQASPPEIPPRDSRRELLALPAVSNDSETTKMDMSSGSASVMLDHLGPIVVGLDGSLSRISNFDKLSELEKKNTLRIISKRNKERLDALKKQNGES